MSTWMNTSAEEIRDLLYRMAERDERALKRLHELVGRRIYVFALHRLDRSDEAETVLIDTLFDIWKSPLRFRGDSKFLTWVLGIASNKILTILRSRKSGHEDIDEYADFLESEAQPSCALEDEQNSRWVKKCIEKLGRTHRECLHLVFYEGLTLREVAEIQEIPENTAKTRLFHARKNIKACLQTHLAWS